MRFSSTRLTQFLLLASLLALSQATDATFINDALAQHNVYRAKHSAPALAISATVSIDL